MTPAVEKPKSNKHTGNVLTVALLAFSASFLSVVFLHFTSFSQSLYYNPKAFLAMVCVYGLFAIVTSLYSHYHEEGKHRDWRSYTLLLSLFVYAFFFGVQALSVNAPFLKSDTVFEAISYWGFFFGTATFFAVLNLPDKFLDFVYKRFTLVLLSVAVFCAFFSGLFYWSPLIGSFLLQSVDAVLVCTEVLFILLIRSFVKGARTHNKSYSVYFVIGLSILAAFSPSVFFVENWTFLWWLHFVVLLVGFSFLLAGFFKKEKQVGKIEEMFPKVFVYSRIGIRFFGYTTLVFILTLAILGYFFRELQYEQINTVVTDREVRAVYIVDTIEEKFDSYKEDIKRVHYLDELKDFVFIHNSDADEEQVEMAAMHVSFIFEGYVQINPYYKKIRYVDRSGKEVIVVEEEESDLTRRYGSELFSDISKEPYFTESLSLEKNEVHVSEVFGVSSEDGVVPIVYIMTPVFDKHAEKAGLIIFDVDAEHFMSVIRRQKSPVEEGRFTLIDQNGHFVVDPDDSSREYWRGSSNREVFPYFEGFREHMLSSDIIAHWDSGNGSAEVGSLEHIVTHAQVLYTFNDIDRYFILAEQTPGELVLGHVKNTFAQSIAILILVVSGGFFLVYVVNIRSVVKRVYNNAEAIRRLESGDLSSRVDVRGKDEVAEVGMGINRLAEELQKKQEEQEKQEQDLLERTNKAEEVNASLEKTKVAVMNILEDLDEEKKKVEDKVEERTRELQEEKSKLGHVTQHMRTGVVFLDKKGKVLVVNKSMRDILGFRDEDIQGIIDVLQKKFSDVDFKRVLTVCSTGEESSSREVEVDDKIYSVAVRCEEDRGVDEKEKGGVFVWVEDVTEDRLIERSKSELVATASHQLRTPLTIARGNVEMLLDEDFGPLNDKQKEMLKDTSDSVIRLITMVNDMLDITKIEKGDLELTIEEFNLQEAIGPVIERLEDYAERHDFDIVYNELKEEVFVVADKEHLQQVFQNLIDNAIRYSRQPGKVEITLLEHSDKGEVEIIIKDNGIGIPKTEQANIFGRFFRAANAVRFASGGSGLGLFIVKSFVEQMNGKIWFESKENEGTTFHVTLLLKK